MIRQQLSSGCTQANQWQQGNHLPGSFGIIVFLVAHCLCDVAKCLSVSPDVAFVAKNVTYTCTQCPQCRHVSLIVPKCRCDVTQCRHCLFLPHDPATLAGQAFAAGQESKHPEVTGDERKDAAPFTLHDQQVCYAPSSDARSTSEREVLSYCRTISASIHALAGSS